MKTLILTFLTFICALRYIEACNCPQSLHPQTHYCNSDFVILANISNQFLDGDFIKYNYVVLKDYKPSLQSGIIFKIANNRNKNKFKKSRKQDVILSPVACPAVLDTYKKYILTGRFVNNEPMIDFCDFNKLESNLTATQREGFENIYAEGCSACDIQIFPYSIETIECKTKDTDLPCYADFSYCKPSCTWSWSEAYQQCETTL